MIKPKWMGTLSTTERNHIGLIRVRQNNQNSEVFGFEITNGNGEPYDLKNRKVLFCTYFDRFSPVEQYAEVVENGKIIYTMNDHDMQKPVRINFAYFKIVDENNNLVDTTQNFSYDIIPSIESKCGNFGPYIIRLEEVLDTFAKVRDNAMKEIEQIIKDFNDQVIHQQKEFDEWFESIREILESIDPGGLLLAEYIKARTSNVTNITYESLADRLNANDGIIYKQVPSGFKFIIQHDSEYQPNVSVTSYKNAIGTEIDGLDTSGEFGGGTISNVPTHLKFDRKKIHIEMPLLYAMTGEIIIPTNNVLLIINNNDVLCFTVKETTITSGTFDNSKSNTSELKIPKNLKVIPIDDYSVHLEWEKGV